MAIPKRLAIAVVVTAITACSGGSRARKGDDSATATTAMQGAGDVALAQMPDSQPVHLVREYVRRDGLGERLRTSPWFDSVITKPEHEPGYDGFTAVAGSAVRPLGAQGDTIRVEVVYHVLGTISQVAQGGGTTGMHFVVHADSENVVFPVVRIGHGWKIESPQIDQHVLPEAILSSRLVRLPEADRAKLKVLAATRER
jgi:hypothetical protein